METVESLREKFMDSQPAPLPAEAYESNDPRRKRSLKSSHAIPKWGWWVIGLALLVVAGATAFVYFGEEAIIASLPAVFLWLGFAIVALAALVIYFLPGVIAMNFRVRRSGAITTLNLMMALAGIAWVLATGNWLAAAAFIFTGWSLALVWAIAEAESI